MIKIIDTTPVVSIKSVQQNQSIREGSSFTFTLEAYPLRRMMVEPFSSIPLNVQLTNTNPSNHIVGFSPVNPVQISSSGSEIRGLRQVTVQTRIVAGMNPGQIRISIGTHPNYKISSTNSSILVNVKDQTLPEISILSNSASVIEGEGINYTLIANPPPQQQMQVRIVATDSGGGHIVPFDRQQTIGLSGSTPYLLDTTNLTTEMENGGVEISVVSESGSNYVSSPINGHVSVLIKDSVKPVVSISSEFDGQVITEGDSFQITLTAEPKPLFPIFVQLSSSENSSSFFKEFSETNPIEIGTNGTKAVIVSTNADSQNVRHSQIRIALDNPISSARYQTIQGQNAVIVKIRDAKIPVVSISPPNGIISITEGESFGFTVRSSPAPIEPISVDLDWSDGGTGHFESFSTGSSLEIGTNGFSSVIVNTRNLVSSKRHTKIGVSLTAGSGNEFKISGSNFAINVGIVDKAKPVVSISSPENGKAITEGAGYSFTLTANPKPFVPILVAITPSSTGHNYFKPFLGGNVVEIGLDGMTTVSAAANSFPNTTNDIGNIIVQIDNVAANANYMVGSAQSSRKISIQVIDTSTPKISLTSDLHGDSIIEGGTFKINVVANISPANPIHVNLAVNDLNLNHFVSFSPGPIVTISNRTSVEVTVSTQSTTAFSHGQITISLVNPTSRAYIINPDVSVNRAIKVGIEDSIKPTVSISASNGGIVTEGQSINLTLIANPRPYAPIMVNMSTSDSLGNHFLSLSEPSPVEIGVDGIKVVTLFTGTESVRKRHGAISITVNSANNADYVVPTSVSLRTIQVMVKDQINPVISITSSSSEGVITEGSNLVFNLEADVVPLIPINIDLDISDGGLGHSNTLSPTEPVEMDNVSSVAVTLTTNNTSTITHGEIEIIINDTNATTYSKSTSNNSIAVGVKDSVKPVISISSNHNNGVISEGDSFTFTLSANPAPYSAIMVDFTAVDSGTGHLGQLTDSNSALIAVGVDGSAQLEVGTGGTADVTVATLNDTSNVRHGEISISLDDVTNVNYGVATNASQKLVKVKVEDQVAPVISISLAKNDHIITEGESFVFSIEANLIALSPISVNLEISDGNLGHYNQITPTTPVSMHNTSLVEVSLTTNNTESIAHGAIEVSINDTNSTTYSKSTTNNSITIGVKDSIKPVVSISSTKNAGVILEGSSFNFTLLANPAPYSPITVEITAVDSGTSHLNQLSDSTSTLIPVGIDGVAEVEIGTSGEADFTVSTLNDSSNVRHGEINIQLNEVTNAEYVIAEDADDEVAEEINEGGMDETSDTAESTLNTIQVKIEDQVAPVISISSAKNDQSIIEGESFKFRIEANLIPLSPILVKLGISDSNLGHFNQTSPTTPVAMHNVSSVEVTLTTNNTSAVTHGEIAVSIDATNETTYSASTTNNSISVEITDTTKPVVSISSIKNGEHVKEGNSFVFRLTMAPAPLAPITVDITAAELVTTGHLGSLSDSSSNTIMVATDGSAQIEIGRSGVADIMVVTINDALNVRHGEIKISLDDVTNADYRIATIVSNKAIQVKIEDRVAPVISISSIKDDQNIIEGESFKFRIEANLIPLSPISVTLDINDNNLGHYNQTSPTAPVAMHNINSVEVTLTTTSTNTAVHGAIDVSINDTNETTYSASNSNDSITVGIKDSVKPVVSIASTFHDEIVTEGGSFTFTLSANPPPYSAIMVDITAVDSGTGQLGQLTYSDTSVIAVAVDGSAQIEIGSSGSAQVTVKTINETMNVRHGTIDISLDEVTNADYEIVDISTDITSEVNDVNLSTNAIQVKIKDSTKPVVTISSNKNNLVVSEGTSFNFTLTMTPAPHSAITVNINAADAGTGHLGSLTGVNLSTIAVAADGSTQVEIGPSGFTQIMVTTLSDTVNVRHGEVNITLEEVTNLAYTISTNSSQNAIQVKIKDNVKPVVSISSTKNNNMVSEGNGFTFSLAATPAPISAIMVDMTAVEIVLTGHFGQITDSTSNTLSLAADGSFQVEIGTSGVADYSVATINDTSNVRHGEIKVSLKDVTNSEYRTATNTSQKVIQVKIQDQVAPIISITSAKNGQSIIEGENIVFRIEANLVPLSPISVNLDISDRKLGHYNAISPTAPILMHNISLVEVSLETNNTAKAEHGEIEISINDTNVTTYSASISNNSITVGIEDSIKPVVSIASIQNQGIVTEGTSFTITLTAIPAPFSSIMVEISAIDLGTGHLGRLLDSNSAVISAGLDGSTKVKIGPSGSSDITVETIVDVENVRHGEISVLLDDEINANYNVTTNSSQQSVRVKVQDQVTPVISISSAKNGQSIVEGEDFTFSIEANLIPLTPIAVKLDIDDGKLGHFNGIIPNSPISMHNVESIDVVLTTINTNRVQHGEIEVSINVINVTTYQASTSSDTITVGVRDSVNPIVSISSIKNNEVVTEGSSFTFTLSATPAPYSAIMVDVIVVDANGNHLGQITDPDSALVAVGVNGSIQVEIGTSGLVQYTVATVNDASNVSHGEINISLDVVSRVDYIVTTNTSQQAVSLKIKDQVAPVISITSAKDNQSITEGESFKFRIEANLMPLLPISVNLDLSDDNLGFYTLISTNGPISMHNVEFIDITFATNITTIVEHNEIVISVNASNETSYSASTSDNSITVGIRDSVKPVVSISSVKNNELVTEGASFTFTLSAIPAPLSLIMVDITATDFGTGHLGQLLDSDSALIAVGANGSAQIEIGTSGTTQVTVATINDTANLRNGEIKISLENVNAVTNVFYKLGTSLTENSIQVRIKDRITPIVSITSNKDGQSIIEGENFSFRLEVEPIPVTPIMVALEIDDGDLGYFGNLSIANPIEIGDSGSVDAVMFTRIVHTIAEPGTISVQVSEAKNLQYAVSNTNSSINIVIKKEIKSVVSIAAHNQNLTAIEGESFEFSLQASPPPRVPIQVTLAAFDGGTGHLIGFLGLNQILVRTDGYAEGTIATRNIVDKVGHGTIRVEILDDPSYLKSSNSFKIEVVVLDKVKSEISEVSVTAHSNPLDENGHAIFSFVAIPTPLEEIKVEILVIQQGDAILWRVPTTILMTGSKSVAIPINMAIDPATNPKISVLIVDHPHYIANSEVAELVISENPVAFVQSDQTRIAIASQVADVVLQIQNDNLVEPETAQSEINSMVVPMVAVTALVDSIQEGQSAQFRFTSTQPLFKLIPINVTQSGNFLQSTPPNQFSLNGKNEAILELVTMNDYYAELDGKITISIIEGNEYVVMEGRESASILVSDIWDRKVREERIVSNIQSLLPQISQAEHKFLNDALIDRFQNSSSESRITGFNLNGHQNLKGLITKTGELSNHNETLVRRLLDQSSFELNIVPDSGLFNTISTWSKSNFKNLSATTFRTGDIGAGELFNGQLGIETEIKPEFIIGIGTSFTRAFADFGSPDFDDIVIQNNSYQLTPYFGWSAVDNSSELRSMIGIGSGEIVATQYGYEPSIFESELYSFAIDGRLELLAELNKTEVDITGQTNFNNLEVNGIEEIDENIALIRRFSRVALEGLHNFDFIEDGLVTPKFSLGILESNSNGHSAKLTEITGGIEFIMPLGLKIDGEGQIYLNQLSGANEWRLDGTLNYDSNQDNLGLAMFISSEFCSKCTIVYENTFGENTSLFGGEFDSGESELGNDVNKISTEFSYGINIDDEVGNFNSFVGLEISGNEITQRRIGGRVSANSNFEIELVGQQDSKLGLDEDYSLKLKGSLNW